MAQSMAETKVENLPVLWAYENENNQELAEKAVGHLFNLCTPEGRWNMRKLWREERLERNARRSFYSLRKKQAVGSARIRRGECMVPVSEVQHILTRQCLQFREKD